MKKFILGLLLLFVVAISLSACRSTKPPCPAYQANSTQLTTEYNYSK